MILSPTTRHGTSGESAKATSPLIQRLLKPHAPPPAEEIKRGIGRLARCMPRGESTWLARLPHRRSARFSGGFQRSVARNWSAYGTSFDVPYLPAMRKSSARTCLFTKCRWTRHGDTYNGHPLWYVALASEKSYLSLHLMPVYGNKALAERLAEAFRTAGKKLDMGKACIHFKRSDDLALDVIAEIVASIELDRWVQIAQAARRR